MKAVFDSAFQCEKCGWVWSDENIMAEHEKGCSGVHPKEGLVELDSTIKNYLPLYDYSHYLCTFNDKQKHEYEQRTTSILSQNEIVLKITNYIEEHEELSKDDKDLLFNIISDDELINKLVFINDGSYRTHRIWCAYNEVTPEIQISEVDTSMMNKHNMIDFMKNNFTIVFIQLMN